MAEKPLRYSTREERATRRRQRNDEAEARLAAAGAAEQQQMELGDPEGVEIAFVNMRAMAEDAAEVIEERQINQAMLAERQQREQQAQHHRLLRRHDYYEQRRRGVRRVLQQRYGRPPTVAEFNAEIGHLVLQDHNWSDDE